jgi:predicted DNA-binding protein YlxM (UPF0122 family)
VSKPRNYISPSSDADAASRALKDAVVVRTRPDDLEAALELMFRASEETKQSMREYFVEGRSMPEIAKRRGCSVENIANPVRRVRTMLAKILAPWQYVSVTLTLPLGLAEDLNELCEALVHVKTTEEADKILMPVAHAVAAAQKKVAGYDHS